MSKLKVTTISDPDNDNTAISVSSTGAVTFGQPLSTVECTTIDLGNWTVTESAGVLYFATGGTNKMKIDATGNLTVVGDITAFGTV